MVRGFYARKYGGKVGRGIGMRRSLLSMKRRSPKSYGVRCFPLPAPPPHPFLTANEKDFSHSLEMTTRGVAFLYQKPSSWGVCEAAFSLLPLEGGVPKGRRLAPQRYERECERVRFPVSSSRAEPRDLFRLRVSSFLCESVCMKHRSVQFIWSMAFPVIRFLASLA